MWKTAEIGEIFETVTGSTPPKNNKSLYGDYLPFVKPPELTDGLIEDAADKLSEKGAEVARILPENSILISCIGNLGKIGWCARPVAFNQQINAIKPNSEILPAFAYYQALSPQFKRQLQSMASGTTVPIVNKSKFNTLKFHYPPRPEQKRIVAILDEAFEGIDKAIANTEQNLANLNELTEDHLNSVFASKRKGWRETELGNVCKFVRGPFGGSLKKSMFEPKGYAVYEQQHAIYDQFQDIRYFISAEKFEEMRRFELATGDLIMSCSGTMGKTAIVPANFKQGIINQALLKLTPAKELNVEFLKLWMESSSFLLQLGGLTKGAAIKNVASVKTLKEIRISYPDRTLQTQVVATIESFRNKTTRLDKLYQRKLDALAELKQSILQKAFNGELTAHEAAA